MALNVLVDSFCHNRKKRGTERIEYCKVLASCHGL